MDPRRNTLASGAQRLAIDHSHSMVLGGLVLTS